MKNLIVVLALITTPAAADEYSRLLNDRSMSNSSLWGDPFASFDRPVQRRAQIKPVPYQFQPAGQVTPMAVTNPEYVARREAALKKPGAVIAQFSIE